MSQPPKQPLTTRLVPSYDEAPLAGPTTLEVVDVKPARAAHRFPVVVHLPVIKVIVNLHFQGLVAVRAVLYVEDIDVRGSTSSSTGGCQSVESLRCYSRFTP